MFQKRFYMFVLLVMMSLVAVLSGCTAEKEPKEVLSSAALHALGMDSFALESRIKISDLTVNAKSLNPNIGAILSALPNAEINIRQIYRKEPMQTEGQLEIKLAGKVATTITAPFVMTKEKLYLQVPSIPFLPMPKSVTGKFVELDRQELAKQNVEGLSSDLLDPEKTQKLGAELAVAVLGEFEPAPYFKTIDPKEAELPEGVKAKQVVRFEVTNDTAAEAATKVIHNMLPKVLDHLQIHQFTVNTAIAGDNYPVYQVLNADVEFNDAQTKDNVKAALQATSTYSHINEKPEFAIGIPEDTITLDKFKEEMRSFGY
ncbi:hypothetical protein [Paenibacillus macerans]|uniref:hypothetical protein n=1 Tax=Paenibacillus macerans TaxID=44252 RepID=UPI00203E1DC3|nr:hypothetical protein [Paenibacillus macerans]MCM3703574.1 hypothetical protein [Paenibacillus macerans]